MIEAMACGTPVVAWNAGSVPEIIEEGRTGFIVDSIARGAAALSRCRQIDRAACAARCRERFSARRMTQAYLSLYRRLERLGRRAA
jgi:glycosyltransferase involved in cell wall biosynthesis